MQKVLTIYSWLTLLKKSKISFDINCCHDLYANSNYTLETKTRVKICLENEFRV